MIDILLPATDAGVLVQVVAVLAIGTGLVIFTRRRTEWRLLAVGGTLFVLALMGLRALH